MCSGQIDVQDSLIISWCIFIRMCTEIMFLFQSYLDRNSVYTYWEWEFTCLGFTLSVQHSLTDDNPLVLYSCNPLFSLSFQQHLTFCNGTQKLQSHVSACSTDQLQCNTDASCRREGGVGERTPDLAIWLYTSFFCNAQEQTQSDNSAFAKLDREERKNSRLV